MYLNSQTVLFPTVSRRAKLYCIGRYEYITDDGSSVWRNIHRRLEVPDDSVVLS